MEDCRMKRICFVGLYEDRNFGDPIIADCTEWLYKNELGSQDVSIKRICLDYVEKHPSFIERLKNKVGQKLHNDYVDQNNEEQLIDKYYKYFRKQFRDIDVAILVGGGLIKYTYQSFSASISGLLKAAQSYNKKVIFNSVGIEGFDADNRRCLRLKEMLHLSCVKAISTRDDITKLCNSYFDGSPTIPCHYVCDPAVWVSEVYGIVRKEHNRTIGIGIGRGGLFEDNGIAYSSEDFKQLYLHLIERLLNSGYNVELFTNGIGADNDFAQTIQQALKEELNVMLKLSIPTTPRDLVNLISEYKAIIAARLHATIIAYSLQIPAIGLVWNNKLTFFGKNINAEDYFIQKDNFSPSYILHMLETSIAKGYDQVRRKEFRALILDEISNNIKNI